MFLNIWKLFRAYLAKQKNKGQTNVKRKQQSVLAKYVIIQKSKVQKNILRLHLTNTFQEQKKAFSPSVKIRHAKHTFMVGIGLTQAYGLGLLAQADLIVPINNLKFLFYIEPSPTIWTRLGWEAWPLLFLTHLGPRAITWHVECH